MGAASFLLAQAFVQHESFMSSMFLGLMVGSLYAIWTGPTTLPTPKSALSVQTFSVVGFLLGGSLLLGLERLQRKLAA